MGILDRFKKKETTGSNTEVPVTSEPEVITAVQEEPQPQSQPQVAVQPVEPAADALAAMSLDELLQRATAEPQFRPEFYRRMLTEELVVIMQREQPTEANPDPEEGPDVRIASFPDGVIPVFTSVDRIYDKGVNKEQLLNMQMPGDKLLALLTGQTLVINPYSDFGKQLLPDEVSKMLDGTIFLPGNIEMEVKQPQQVRLGIPSVYPTEVMNAMTQLFASRAEVSRAYVAFIQFEGGPEQPHYIYAIEESSGQQHIGQEIGTMIQQMRPGEVFDLVRLPGNTFDEFFYKHHQPFYTK